MRLQGTRGLFILYLLPLCHCTSSTNWNQVNCTTRQDCHPDMSCRYRKCECKYDSTFDKVKDICARLVGESCSETAECVSNAECDQNKHICLCHGPDFSETEGGKCAKNYGVPCQNQSDCNPDKYLTCRANKCDCTEPMKMGFSLSRGDGGCTALPGDKCQLKPFYDSHIKLECGIHATCINSYVTSRMGSHDGICECDPGYIRVGENQTDCMPSFGSPCNSTEPCAPNLHLNCSGNEEDNEYIGDSGACKCEFIARIEILNDTLQPSCVLLEGVSCIPGESICTQNAECSRNNSICECKFGYSRTPSGHCKLSYNTLSCHEENDNCNEFVGLKCINNRCKCHRGQIYDQILRKCVIPVGQACDPINSNSSCPNHAICDPRTAVCICREQRMLPRPSKPDGFCHPSFGAPCNTDNYITSCSGGNYLICGPQNVCHCNNASVFEKETEKCFLRAGAKCEAKRDVCVSRANCEDKSAIETGICECGTGYVHGIEDGRCRLSHGKFCNPTENECSPDLFLSCIQTNNSEYRCGCSEEDGLVYEEITKSCRILSGFPCDSGNNTPICFENSVCVKNFEGQDSHVCKCADNFKSDNSTKHRCIPAITNYTLNQTHISSIGNTIVWSTKESGWFGSILILYYMSCILK